MNNELLSSIHPSRTFNLREVHAIAGSQTPALHVGTCVSSVQCTMALLQWISARHPSEARSTRPRRTGSDNLEGWRQRRQSQRDALENVGEGVVASLYRCHHHAASVGGEESSGDWKVRKGSPARVCGELGRLAEDWFGWIMTMKEWILYRWRNVHFGQPFYYECWMRG